ncbi:MAG: hypothetical protein HQK60_11200 [Deltaproteobacteria bacterium]|nr:hypothetical protein [Deltaproteobacteria bacterium]
MKKGKMHHMWFIISVIALLAVPSLSGAQDRSGRGVTDDVVFYIVGTGCNDTDGNCYIYGNNTTWPDGRRFIIPSAKQDQYLTIATTAITFGRTLVIRVSDPGNLGTLTKMEYGPCHSLNSGDAGQTSSDGQ